MIFNLIIWRYYNVCFGFSVILSNWKQIRHIKVTVFYIYFFIIVGNGRKRKKFSLRTSLAYSLEYQTPWKKEKSIATRVYMKYKDRLDMKTYSHTPKKK